MSMCGPDYASQPVFVRVTLARQLSHIILPFSLSAEQFHSLCCRAGSTNKKREAQRG